MPGLHDSLVGARAQVDLLLSSPFVPFLDQTNTLSTVDNVFGAKQLSELKEQLGPICPVHDPWIELSEDNDAQWKPSTQDSYNGRTGGPPLGPTAAIQRCARTATDLSVLFFFILPLSFFAQVVSWSDQYCYKDWVVTKIGKIGAEATRRGHVLKRYHRL